MSRNTPTLAELQAQLAQLQAHVLEAEKLQETPRVLHTGERMLARTKDDELITGLEIPAGSPVYEAGGVWRVFSGTRYRTVTAAWVKEHATSVKDGVQPDKTLKREANASAAWAQANVIAKDVLRKDMPVKLTKTGQPYVMLDSGRARFVKADDVANGVYIGETVVMAVAKSKPKKAGKASANTKFNAKLVRQIARHNASGCTCKVGSWYCPAVCELGRAPATSGDVTYKGTDFVIENPSPTLLERMNAEAWDLT